MDQVRRAKLLFAAWGLFAAGGLLVGPLGAMAQQAEKPFRIGFLSFEPLPNAKYDVFRLSLQDLKYVEGRSYVMVTRSAENRRDRLPQLASELALARPDLIVATTGNAALAAKSATSTIPIVMTGSSDAVAQGIVKSLARPGGNVTGFTVISPDVAPKRLQLLASLQGLAKVAVLWCPESPINREELSRTSAVAPSLGMQILPVEFRQKSATWQSLEAALDRAHPQALFLVDCTYLPFEKILDYALRHRLPTISPNLRLAEMGVLLAYGADAVPMVRGAAILADKILKGASPASLPVEQPTKFDLVINLRTARALDLSIPQALLLRAERVIE